MTAARPLPPKEAAPSDEAGGIVLKDPKRQEAEQRQIAATSTSLAGINRLLLVAVVVLAIALLVSGYALFWRFPGTNWLWTSDAGAVCDAVPLIEPTISDARVIDFAAGAAIDLNSFDYRNWRRTIDGVLSARFTPAARDAYLDALEDTGILRRIIDGRYVVSAISDGMPFLADHGIAAGRRFWRVQVPFIVEYRTEAEIRREHRVFVATVVRIAPSPANPNGIAIDLVASTQRTAADAR